MTDHPRIPLAAVIGSPIAHSRSPALHGYWLKRYGIKGFYIPMDVAQADLAAVLRMLPKMGFVGANVTIPHKEAILQIADVISDRAALIGGPESFVLRAANYEDFTQAIRQKLIRELSVPVARASPRPLSLAALAPLAPTERPRASALRR
jgi:hypothetical protein